MTLTTAAIQAKFRAARTVLAGSKVSVRIDSREYDGTRSTLELIDDPEGLAALQEATGAVRLDLSELREPFPEAGDKIEIKEPDEENEWKERRVILPRYDQPGATVLIAYGERDGTG